MAYDTKDHVGTLNSLVRGEISAAETYKQAIEKVQDDDGGRALEFRETLREIQQEHGENAQLLREEIRRLGGEADKTSGTWGAYAKIVQGVSNLFGDASALKALKEGEEHGLKEYQEALAKVDDTSRRLLAEIIPVQQGHIATLDTLINSIGRARETHV